MITAIAMLGLWLGTGIVTRAFGPVDHAECVRQVEAQELSSVCYEEMYGRLSKEEY